MLLKELRQQVVDANHALPECGLVKWSSGNASGRDPASGLVVIKPSGYRCNKLTPEELVITDIDGNVIEGDLKPSVDTQSHLYIYRHRPDVNGIVHTHSPFATSFAVRGEALPIYTTTGAAYFGGDVPISDFAVIGEEEIGKEIIAKIGNNLAILMRNHGVFAIGETVSKALVTAVYLEEEAEVVHLANLRGQVDPLPLETVTASRAWFLESYGQPNS